MVSGNVLVNLLLGGVLLLGGYDGVEAGRLPRRRHQRPTPETVIGSPADLNIYGSNRTTHPWGDDPQELVRRDGTKYVFMHHIVGNTYPYTEQDWENDIREIAAKGIDAIAMNIGSSDWQRSQLATAYSVTARVTSSIKLFISFDFAEMACDATDVISRINVFKDHPAQFKINGKVFVSSYGGGRDCLGGNEGWARIKRETNAYLMPFVWGIEGQFGDFPALDTWYCWGCAWPQGYHDKTTADDEYYLSQLGSRYATTVSMWMFTHLPSKNFYLRGDNWLINNRWEQLVNMRDRLTFVEMLTWNDYGESDYFGPIRGAQPAFTDWADNFPHTAWFDMSQYYIQAFKTGVYPAITKDVIYYWSRPHPAGATASSDSLGRPENWNWAEDFMYAAIFATSPASAILTMGSSTSTFSLTGGVNKVKIPTAPGRISIRMVRGGVIILDKTDTAFEFVQNPVRYNYNAYVGAATATVVGPTSTSSSSPSSTTSSTPTPSTTIIDGVTWSYQGCYSDDSNSRTLYGGLFISDQAANSRTKCLRRCASEGYAYGGVEYGIECFCSQAIRAGVTKTAEADCNMPCSGNANERCGAGARINVFSRVVPSSTTTTPTTTQTAAPTSTVVNGVTWNYRGCYPDTTSARTLYDGAYIVDTSDNSRSKCLTTCAQRGYMFGGVEYGQECFCSNGIRAGVNPGSEASCSQACSGNANEKCGAGGRINIWERASAPSSTIPTSTLPAGPTVTGWAHKGCIAEGTTGTNRALTGATFSRGDMTPQLCQSLCGSYQYAGVEYGVECYCGNSFQNGATGLPIADSRCSSQCGGDASQRCGGGWTLDLYQKTSITWNNLGCHMDTSDRMLRGYSTSQTGMTNAKCVGICNDRGFAFAATQYGLECYCGKELFQVGNTGKKTGEEECNVPCSGDSTQFCGAGWRSNAYSRP